MLWFHSIFKDSQVRMAKFNFISIPEFCGPLCAQYQHVFLQPLLEYIKDKSPEVRQAATYGCGVLAQVRFS